MLLMSLAVALAGQPAWSGEPESHPDLASKYRLDTGDLIRIDVFGEKDLTVEAKLTDAGTISYPFLGEIIVRGMTISDLAERITEELKGPYLRNPQVSVNLIQYRDFFVNGEVAKPGGYAYQPGLTVQKAVTIAGGFNERASRTSIVVIRASDSKQGQTPVELNAAIGPGDVLVVEESFF
jgi:polysaccharide export outer membrane protein